MWFYNEIQDLFRRIELYITEYIENDNNELPRLLPKSIPLSGKIIHGTGPFTMVYKNGTVSYRENVFEITIENVKEINIENVKYELELNKSRDPNKKDLVEFRRNGTILSNDIQYKFIIDIVADFVTGFQNFNREARYARLLLMCGDILIYGVDYTEIKKLEDFLK